MKKKVFGNKTGQKFSKPSDEGLNWSFPSRERFPGAVKRMISYQIQREMARQGISQAQFATGMKTSRAAVNRLLDPENKSITLQTLERASQILGKRLQVFLED